LSITAHTKINIEVICVLPVAGLGASDAMLPPLTVSFM
jgi:hypothetical protein